MPYLTESENIYNLYILKENVISESPDFMHFFGIDYVFGGKSKPITFCILDDRYVLYSTTKTHNYIFNALKKIENADSATQEFEYFSVKSIPSKVDQNAIDSFKNKFDQTARLSQLREGLKSGRIWKNIKAKMEKK